MNEKDVTATEFLSKGALGLNEKLWEFIAELHSYGDVHSKSIDKMINFANNLICYVLDNFGNHICEMFSDPTIKKETYLMNIEKIPGKYEKCY